MWVDTQKIDRGFQLKTKGSALSEVKDRLEIEQTNMHNAGNDAWVVMKAIIRHLTMADVYYPDCYAFRDLLERQSAEDAHITPEPTSPAITLPSTLPTPPQKALRRRALVLLRPKCSRRKPQHILHLPMGVHLLTQRLLSVPSKETIGMPRCLPHNLRPLAPRTGVCRSTLPL